MSGARAGCAFSIAVLAAIVLPCAGMAQMRQSGNQEQEQQAVNRQSASATSSSAYTTATSASANPAGASSDTANPAGVSSGASSWIAGKGSFGITSRMPAGSSAGARSGSWAAGSGSFGMKAQPGGIWRETGGGSLGTQGTASMKTPAVQGFAPAAFPGLSVTAPAAVSAPGRARSGGGLASRSPAGARSTTGARFGAANGSRTGGFKSAGSRTTSVGSRGQTGSQSRIGQGRGSSANPSIFHNRTPVPSAFAPPHSSSTTGMHESGTGGGSNP